MKKVTAYVHSHWDREWYREFEEFRLRLIEVFDEVLNALETGELPCFYFDGQTAALEDYLEIFPNKINLIKKFIKEKKLRIGPFYCSSDSFLVSGESLYRNLEIGMKKSKELGETDFIGYLSDSFGHSQYIPYLLKAFNIDKACMWRGLGNYNANLDWNGIKVTNLIQGYFQDFLNLNIPTEKKAQLLKKYIDKISEKSNDNVLLPIGADHLKIPENITEQIKSLNKLYDDYEIKISTPFEYFDKVKKREKVTGEFLENTLNFILPGVYSTRIYIKQANSYSQWLLSKIAEPFNAISSFYFNAKNKQSEIDYAYKTIIKNHAHDSIYGCCIDKVPDEMMTRYDKINSVSNGVIKRTLRDISDEKGNLSVVNLSGFDYNGTVKIVTNKKLPKWMNAEKLSSEKGFTDKKLYNINEIPITEDYTNLNEYMIDVQNIKAFSLCEIKKENICNKNYLKINKNSIENKHIKFEVKNGEIEITDKIKNNKYTNFISITDRADIGDSYNFGALKNDNPINAKLVKFEIKKSTKQIAIINLTYKLNIPKTSVQKGRSKKTLSHKFNIDVILKNQSEFIEFEINWENKSCNHILQIGFNLKEKIYSTISEDLFGTVKRKFNPDFDIYKAIPAARGKEIKPNTSPMQRFMYTQDFGLITKGNVEYEIIKNTVYLTLLRSTGIISNPTNTTRGTPAGPPLKAPKMQCLGENSTNFAITFSKTEKDMYRLTDEFYSMYIALFTKYKSKTFYKTSNYIYAVKSDKNNLLIRTFDINKKELHNNTIRKY